MGILKILFLSWYLFSCTAEPDLPSLNFQEPQITPNISLRAFKNGINRSDDALTVTENLIFEGYVISSDEAGNFYKSLVIVNETGSTGLQINIQKTGSYIYFEPGRKVYIRAKGLTAQWIHDALNLGIKNSSSSISGIPDTKISDFIIRSHVSKPGQTLAQQKTISGLSDLDVNTLVQIEQTEFLGQETGFPLYSETESIGSGTNRTIIDPSGQNLILRVSQYAAFANHIIPEKSGTIIGVLQKYGSDLQLMIRYFKDLNLTQEMQYGSSSGNDMATIHNCLNEAFDHNLAYYQNININGGRYWSIDDYGGNNYLSLSSYQLNDTLDSWFIVGVDFDAVSGISFETKDGYYKGDVLHILISNEYNNDQNIDLSQWEDITDSFTISSGKTSGYASSFTASGDYSLDNYSGTGFVAFRYKTSSASTTTTIQIDNIKLSNSNISTCFY